MNLNWSNRVIKYVLFIFNLLFVISGIIMVAVGVSVKSYYTDYDIFLNGSYFSLPNLLIAIGSLIFFISLIGCCGAIKENWFLVFIFSILLGVIFIMEFSAGIAGYVLRDKTTSYLSEELLNSMKNYEPNPVNNKANGVTKMWDTIQYEFECCGANGPTDWPKKLPTPTPGSTTPSGPTTPSNLTTLEPTTTTTKPTIPTTPPPANTTEVPEPTAHRLIRAVDPKQNLPTSCCKSRPGTTGQLTCNLDDTDTATYYKRGCVEGFGGYLKDHAVTLGGVGIAIAFIQLFGVIFACHLTKQLKNGFRST